MHGRASVAVRMAVVTVSFALALPAAASAVALPSNTPASIPVPNGLVHAVEAVGDTVYVGGDFTQVGPLTGPGVSVDRSAGARKSGFPVLNGDVYDVISDDGTLSVSAPVKKRKLALGSAKFKLGPGSATVKVKLKKAGRGALAKTRKLRVVITATAKDAAGNSITVMKTVMLTTRRASRS